MNLLVIPIIFLAMLIHTLMGFGSALVAMPLLLMILSPDEARPAFAIIGQISSLITIYKYRHDWQFEDIWRTLCAAIIGVSIGIFIVEKFDEQSFMLFLGLVVAGYALYSLVGFKVPELPSRWAYFFGFVAGFLHSAYNVGGPPLVIYGSSQNWLPKRFKGNTQVVFFSMGFFVIGSHVLQGRITTPVLLDVALMLPASLVAMALGFFLDKYIKPQQFRVAVLVFLLILGLNLIF